jgi:selenocysteine lyase/cysteine desulfurase
MLFGNDPDIDTATNLSRRELLAGSLQTTLKTALGAACLATLKTAAAQPTELPTSTRELWQWVRLQPVSDPRITWFDAASGCSTLRAAMATEYRAREAQSTDLASRSTNGYWSGESQRLATRFAAFAGCDPDEILFSRGTGEGLSTVAAGLDLVSGDEVITTSQEHPAALSPWLFQVRRRGIVVKQVQLPVPLTGPEQALGLLAGAVTERTKVMAFSHVQYADGTVMPVRELCQLARQRNITTVVDGAQAFGMLEFALRDLGCDFYATGFHKWLAGCHGTGMLYVRRELLARIWPLEPRGIDASPAVMTPTISIGQDAVPTALHKLGNIVPHAWPALRGAEAALDFQEQVRRSRIEARIRELAIYARMRLQQVPGIELLTPGRPGLWAGILTFRVPGRRAADIADALMRGNRVYVSSLNWAREPRAEEGALRIALHIFNSHDDVEQLLQGLQRETGRK